jgi:hypothetical protein
MALADEYPDYDFSALKTVSPATLTSAAHTLDDSAAQLQRGTAALAAGTRGMTWDQAHERLAIGGQGWRDAASHYAQVSAEVTATHRAISDWERDAPRHAEIQEAEEQVADAKRRLGVAAGTAGASMRRQQLQQAMDHMRDLIAKRESADNTLAGALDKSAEKLGGGHWIPAETHDGSPGKPPVPDHNVGTPTPKPTAPGPAAPHTGTPGPVAAPAAPAGTGTSSTITPAQASAIAALLARPQGQPALPQLQQPQQPAAVSPPTAPAAASMGGSQPRNGKSGAITADDVDAIAPVPLPLSSAAHVTTQAPAPIAPAPPAPPAVTGTSSTDWHTNADTSGRSEGPRTALSSGVPEQAVGRVAAGGAGAAGQPQTAPLGQQMMPPMMGGMGGAGAAGRATKVLKYSPEQAELQGHLTISEAVRGGTILQRPVGDAAA